MDRREAMKKIAVGGATVVGASAVVSSPAFAHAGPTIVSPGTLSASINVDNNRRRRITLSLAGASVTCPTSASGGTVGGPTFSSALTETTSIGLQGRSGTGGSWVALPTNVSGAVFQIRKSTAGSPAGAVVSAVVTITFTCTYDNRPPTPPVVRSTSYTQTITLNF